nr:MAG TPA: Putative Head Tail Connector Protein [Caudoviricetes sp.]
MNLIIEDGTCPEGTNSYVSLAAADAYLVPRGLWPTTPVVMTPGEEGGPSTATPDAEMVAAKEAALIRAFDYLNGPLDWVGYKVDWQREPAWPRLSVPVPGTDPCMGQYIPSDVVPRAVVQAQMEIAALMYGGKDLFTPQERGGAVVSESHSTKEGGVDVIGGDSESHSYTYADDAPAEDWLPSVFPLLEPFLNSVPGQVEGGFSMVKVVRG